MKKNEASLSDPVRRHVVAALGAAGVLGATPLGAFAQTPWPSQPISYIVPFPPGGLTDVAARAVGKALGDAHQWNVVIENKPGGNANIGAAQAARARPDGYTWLAITLSHAANATLFAGKAGYDLLADLTPVAGIASSPMLVVVSEKSGIKSMDDLRRAAGSRQLTAGSSGNGTPPHLTLALYEKITGARFTHVPYKGGAPSLTDLMGGHVDVIFSNYPESLSHVKAGALRALALTAEARSADLPDVPTVAEAGVPELIVGNFTGVLAPAGTSNDVVRKVGEAIVAELQKPAMQEQMVRLGFIPQPRGPAAFGEYLQSEVRRWATIIEEAGIRTA